MQCLQAHNIKATEQRIAVLDYLMEHKTHPNVEEIYVELSHTMPTLSKTTIYNTLNLFVQSGLALELNFSAAESRYDGDMRPHAHFHCRKCNRVYDMPMPVVVHERMHVHAIEHTQVYYSGVCNHCKEE